MASRVYEYDARQLARQMRETFADRPVETETKLPFSWPRTLQNVGESLAVAYGSDKWKPKKRGRREVELYKHLAESQNWAFVTAGVLHDFYAPEQAWPIIGPTVSFESLPLPQHIAILGYCDSAHLRLYTRGTHAQPRFGRGDEGIVEITFPGGLLAGSKILWNEVEPYRSQLAEWWDDNPDAAPEQAPDYDEPFLAVYTPSGGVMMVVVGEELDIRREGIVG